MNVIPIIPALAETRPLFHSEADFQHALAWEIHRRNPDARLRLEYRPGLAAGRSYADIWVQSSDGWRTVIELKYKTRSLATSYDGEPFELLNQSAQDTGRYDFLKDISRLERWTAADGMLRGIAILLTNDSMYWSPNMRTDTSDAAFRIHEGRTVTGQLTWGRRAGAGSICGREAPIELVGSYDAVWREYSDLQVGKASRFRYLVWKVEQH